MRIFPGDEGVENMTKAVNPPQIHSPFANYSHAIRTEGAMLFVSGQLGVAADGSIPECARGQAEQCFANITEILAAAGFETGHVARINAFVTDRRYLRDYMAARDAWVGPAAIPPASTLVIVAGFARPEFKVEVEVTACLGRQ